MNVINVTDYTRKAFDAFIQSVPNGSFRQGYAWGEVMSYDMEIIRLAVEDKGSIIAALSIQRKKLPGLPYSIMYAPRGPIAKLADKNVMSLLLAKTYRIAKEDRTIFLRIDPDFTDGDIDSRNYLLETGFKYLDGKNWSYFNYPRVLMRLNIIPDEDVLLGNMRKKHRQHINTVDKKGVVIEDGVTKIHEFYMLMSELSARKGFLLRSFDYYCKLMDEFGDDAKILIARYDGRAIAGVLSLVYGNKSWYMHGATVEDKGNIHPVEALHWEMIKWTKSRGSIFYDLGGTGTDYPVREDNQNYYLYNFKKGFGAEIAYLTGYYDYVFNKPLYKVFRIVEEKALHLGMKTIAILKKKYSHHE